MIAGHINGEDHGWFMGKNFATKVFFNVSDREICSEQICSFYFDKIKLNVSNTASPTSLCTHFIKKQKNF